MHKHFTSKIALSVLLSSFYSLFSLSLVKVSDQSITKAMCDIKCAALFHTIKVMGIRHSVRSLSTFIVWKKQFEVEFIKEKR